MNFSDFWYVVAQSEQLRPGAVLSRTVLGEWLALFRGEDGRPVALRDRCVHRNSRLSTGRVCGGKIHCPYHGWVYDSTGAVVAVPAEGDTCPHLPPRWAYRHETCEQDGYVYVRLRSPVDSDAPLPPLDSEDSEYHSFAPAPFPMPFYGQPGWATVRVINRFQNTVTNCAENFIDVPHTAFVHPGVFRTSRRQPLEMTVTRRNGSVLVEYRNETNNLGWFSRFLNGDRQEIQHTDSFHMPNVTSVEYATGPHRRLFITSQSVPEGDRSTLVYTDVTYNYGLWTTLARPLIRWTAQHIIRQDIEILATQRDVIEKYGQQFSNTPADTIHVFVESIRNSLAAGKDPRTLPDKTTTLKFWV